MIVTREDTDTALSLVTSASERTQQTCPTAPSIAATILHLWSPTIFSTIQINFLAFWLGLLSQHHQAKKTALGLGNSR